jgi:hypothetical protein
MEEEMALHLEVGAKDLLARLPRSRRSREDEVVRVGEGREGVGGPNVSSERRGAETLRRFLLDLDAKDANCSTDGMTPRDFAGKAPSQLPINAAQA